MSPSNSAKRRQKERSSSSEKETETKNILTRLLNVALISFTASTLHSHSLPVSPTPSKVSKVDMKHGLVDSVRLDDALRSKSVHNLLVFMRDQGVRV